MGSRTQPGSRAHRYVQIIWARAEDWGRGLEMDEIRKAYHEETGEPAPDSLTAEISSLKRRGVLEMTGGRPNHSRYAPVELDLDESEEETPQDDVLVVFQAVERGWERLGRALSTAEVDQEIERAGEELDSDDPNAVKKRLDTLSRRTERGPEEFRAPKVRRIEARSMHGKPSNHWVPAEVEGPAAELVAPRSRADALRRLVYRVEEDIGRPPSRRELQWWAESPAAPEPLLSKLDLEHLGAALHDVAKADQDFAGEPGRLRPITTSLTCDGGPNRRWTLHEVEPRQQALCELEATLQVYRVPEEIRSLRGLQQRADRQGGDVLPRLVSTRRGLLLDSLREAAGEYEPGPLLEDLEVALETLQGRLAATDGLTEDQEYDRRTALRERLQAVRSTQGALRFLDATGDAGQLNRVSEGGTTLLEDFEPVLETAGDMLGLDERQQHRLVKRVRRFPLPEKPHRGPVGSRDTTPPYSTMDRPDALAAVFELFSVPRARTLITEARQLLGHVLRDPAYLQGLLDQLGDSPAPERPALIVALGLLGTCPEFDEAVVNSADADDTRAWVLATILAEWEEAEARLEQVLQHVERPAQRDVDQALRRVRAGYLPSAIE